MPILIGRILTAVIVVILLADASVNWFAPNLIQADMDLVQFPAARASTLAIIMVVCAILYASPVTSFFGAILVTGFLGGAICMHFRIGELFSPPQVLSLVLGAITWGALCLRDKRLRGLILRR